MRITHKKCNRAISVCWRHSIILMTNALRVNGEKLGTGTADAYNLTDFSFKKLSDIGSEKFIFCPSCNEEVEDFSALNSECGCCGRNLVISEVFTSKTITSICSSCISKLKELAQAQISKPKSLDTIEGLMNRNILWRIIATYGASNIVAMSPNKTYDEMLKKLLKD